MRFGSGPGSFLWPVRWYKTDLPFVPFPNVYCSHNWDADPKEWEDNGQAGEVYGAPRPWRNGEPPPPPITGAWKGDAAAWAGSLAGPRYTPCSFFPTPEEGAFDSGYDWGYLIGTV